MENTQAERLKEFNRLYKAMDDLYHEISLKNGMSDSMFTILYDLCFLGEGCLQRDICDASWVSKQTVNSAMRRLELLGYVYLEPGKGRDKHIFLTDSGKRLVEEKIAPVIRMEQETFGELSREESSELLRLTEKYVKTMQRKVREE